MRSSGTTALRGIACSVGAVSIFSIQDVIIKQLSGTLSVLEIVCFRSFVALPTVVLIAALTTGLGSLRAVRADRQLLRSVLMLMSYTSYYVAISLLPLADAIAIAFASPLFVALLSGFVLRERIDRTSIAMILVGFVGVLLIVRPGSSAFQPGSLVALFAAFINAVVNMYTRRLGETDSSAAISLWTMIIFFIGSGLSLPFDFVQPAAGDYALFAVCGVIGGTGHVLVALAYRTAPASTVAPFDYTAILWGVLFGFLFFADLPDAIDFAGIILLIASGLVLVRRAAATP